MNRQILLAALCVGIAVRYSPAQDYVRSRYTSNDQFDRTFDTRGRYESRPGEYEVRRPSHDRQNYASNRSLFNDRIAPVETRRVQFPVRTANYASPVQPPRVTHRVPACANQSYRPPIQSYGHPAPSLRPPAAYGYQGYGSSGPVQSKSRTYIGRNLTGQPVLYTDGQPIRNFFRSLAP